MPRIANSGPNIDKYIEEYSEGSSIFDICNDCWEEYKGESLESMGLYPFGVCEPMGTETELTGDAPVELICFDDSPCCCEICDEELTWNDFKE